MDTTEQTDSAAPAERHVALIHRYVDSGRSRCRVNVGGIIYDTSEREYALLQWGKTPAELKLIPHQGR